MKDKQQNRDGLPKEEAEEVRRVRHTISSEETFTLAKDVYDIRCFIKKVYSNRAVIKRRLNVVSLAFSLAFTAAYVALILYLAITNHLSQGWEIAVYTILGVYCCMVACMAASTFAFGRGTAKTYSRNGKILKAFRLAVRLSSLAMSIAALSLACSRGAVGGLALSVRVTAIIISAISICLSLIPLFFGGLGGLARWLLSPTKVNKRFSAVVLEWYGNVSSPASPFSSTQRVEKALLDDISRCVDSYILPVLGKRKLSAIDSSRIFAAVDYAPTADRPVVEGVIKSVFEYAVECNYTTVNPCRDMHLEGSVEVRQKPKKEPFKVRLGKKIGSSIIKHFLGEPKDKDKK